uniref:Uncharacterized protein n=1 Tax=Anguilla anguilla TaxID=7936 RepID=A0A0E9PF44_ANGAN
MCPASKHSYELFFYKKSRNCIFNFLELIVSVVTFHQTRVQQI